eukprot:Opistho-1_new@46315
MVGCPTSSRRSRPISTSTASSRRRTPNPSSYSSIANRAERAGWPRPLSRTAGCRRPCIASWSSAAASCRRGWPSSSACVTSRRRCSSSSTAARRGIRRTPASPATASPTHGSACAPHDPRPSALDRDHRGHVASVDLALARPHHLERRDQSRQFSRRQQERGVAWLAPGGLGQREGLVDQHARRHNGSDDRRHQRPVQVVGDQDEVEGPVAQIDIVALEVLDARGKWQAHRCGHRRQPMYSALI